MVKPKLRKIYFDETISNFPRENIGIVPTVVVHLALYLIASTRRSRTSGGTWRAALWFRSSDDSRADTARLLVAIEDLGHAAMRDAQLPRDDARTDTRRRQFDDLQADVIRKRPTVDKDSAKLINTTLSYILNITMTRLDINGIK